MSEAEVRKIAKGRVWNGKDALAHGLVDCLGGLQDAIELAKTEAGLSLEVSLGSLFAGCLMLLLLRACFLVLQRKTEQGATSKPVCNVVF